MKRRLGRGARRRSAFALALMLAGVTCEDVAVAEEPSSPIVAVVPTALLQVDGQAHPQEEEGFDGFSIARMRAGVWSRPSPLLFGLVQAEFADPEHPVILDGYARFGPVQGLRLTAGYFRSPLFASARTELEGTNPFPELSMPVRGLWPGRDLGLELHYTPLTLPLEAWLRFSNGSASPLANDNQSFAWTGRVDATVGRGRWNATGCEPFGLRVGVGALADDTFDRAGVAGRIATGFVYYRPPTISGPRRIVEMHALAFAGPLRALAEVGGAIESRAADTDGNPATPRVNLDPSLSRGGAVELAWMITGEQRISSTWPVRGRPRPLAFDRPAIEVAGRAERLDVGRGTRDVAPGGATGWAGAVNVWLNELVAVTVAGYVYRYDRAPIEEPNRLDSWIFLARLTMFLNPAPVGSTGGAN